MSMGVSTMSTVFRNVPFVTSLEVSPLACEAVTGPLLIARQSCMSRGRYASSAVAVIGDSLTPPVNYHIKAVKILTQLIGKGK
jgi:hypothetical protein